MEQILYSKYGGHGLKLFVHCLPRDFGNWIIEIKLLTARSSDYTGYDFTAISTLNERLGLRYVCLNFCLQFCFLFAVQCLASSHYGFSSLPLPHVLFMHVATRLDRRRDKTT
jgi:hypothetical protein